MEYDIYDPSHTVGGDYWQVGYAREATDSKQWQIVADLVNQGLPEAENALFRQAAVDRVRQLWGCLRRNRVLWVYRVFLAGRDSLNRPGRYFFILVKAPSPDDLHSPSLARIVRNLQEQTSIPLDIQGLGGLSGSSLDSIAPGSRFGDMTVARQALPPEVADRIPTVPDGGHHGWVIDANTGLLREHKKLPSGTDTGSPRAHSKPVDGPLPLIPSTRSEMSAATKVPTEKPKRPSASTPLTSTTSIGSVKRTGRNLTPGPSLLKIATIAVLLFVLVATLFTIVSMSRIGEIKELTQRVEDLEKSIDKFRQQSDTQETPSAEPRRQVQSKELDRLVRRLEDRSNEQEKRFGKILEKIAELERRIKQLENQVPPLPEQRATEDSIHGMD